MIAGYITARVTFLSSVRVVNNVPQLISIQRYFNEEFSTFDSMLSLYLRKNKTNPTSACFGAAGPVINNSVSPTNIKWQIKGKELSEKYGIKKVTVLNDLEATARGLFLLSDDKFFTINKGTKVSDGNIGLIAAGNGLGEGLIYYDGKSYHPYASEGGHVGFSPGNQIEAELWEYLYSQLGFVEAEDVISLNGLERIFEFLLIDQRVTKPDWYKKADDKPSKLIEMALSGKDEIAEKTVELFVDCFASEAANLALKGMTMGGIYLVGYIAPQIIPFLDKGRFMERFLQKGKMESLLSRMPVRLIIDSKTALLGAAAVAAGKE